MEKKQTKKQHGGPHPGAGRPPIYGPRQRVLILLPLPIFEALEATRASRGLSQSLAVQEALEQWLQKPKLNLNKKLKASKAELVRRIKNVQDSEFSDKDADTLMSNIAAQMFDEIAKLPKRRRRLK